MCCMQILADVWGVPCDAPPALPTPSSLAYIVMLLRVMISRFHLASRVHYAYFLVPLVFGSVEPHNVRPLWCNTCRAYMSACLYA